MGRADPAVIDGLLGQLRQLGAEASLENLDAILSNPSNKDLAGSVGVVHFLKLLRRSQRSRGIPDSAPASLAAVLELQTLSASAPVPSDPRTQEWVRVATAAADVARRRADDALLAGQADPASAESAARGYREGLAIANAVREALVLTDLAAAELPDLARWLVSSASDHDAGAQTGAPNPADMVNQLLNLVNAAHLLVNNLHAPRDADSAADLSILPQYRSFLSQYEGLRQHFDDACERLVTNSESSPQRAHQAAAILELPLLSSRMTENGLNPLEQRRKIQALYSQSSRELHRRSLEHGATAGGTGGKSDALRGDEAGDSTPVKSAEQPRVGDLIIALIEPLRSAVADEKTQPGSTAIAETPAAAKGGAQVRRALQAVPGEIEAARERHLASADQPRLEWSRAARLARCTAPFITSPWPIDPVAELRRVDIQQILVWHAGRYLDDFWGPCVSGEPCYFDSATTDAIDAARLISIPNPAVEKQIAALNALLALRQKASRMGLVVRADPLLLVDLADQPAAHVAVSRNPAVADDGLPAGLAMLRIADQSGNLLGPVVDFPIQGTALPRIQAPGQAPEQAPDEPPATSGDSKPQELKLPLGSIRHELTDTIGAATAIFRGHEFRDDLVIKTAAGTTVEARPRTIRNARIRLNGNKRQRASVVFVLDCSASMRKGMPFESTNEIVPRMEVAKAALVRMMTALAARGDARVGVLLYGHRVGWSTKEPNQLLTQATWGGTLPEGLKPYEDVETILPLGRFDSIAAAKVAQRLEKVKPWGETPLYLSLIQALREFKDDDPDAQQSVVVITDGVNYQFNPRPEMAKTAQDVLAADATRRIPLHIVGFGIEANETQQAQRDFSRLASETGGQYVSVSEAAALANTLEDILQRRPYSVVSPLGRTVKAPIGTAIDLSWELDDPQDYTVAVDALSEPVELTGGEAIELFISQDGQSLISAAYDAGAPRFAALVGGSPRDPRGVRLGVHQPLREGTTVTFDLSLQQEQQRFVRRPREVWIEITPILGDNRPAASRKYVIYDPEFVPQTPVPVLRAIAHSWPKEARRSRIDFWCKWTATEPSLVIPCTQLTEPGRGDPAGATLGGIPGMKYQVRERPGTPLRIDFIETYAADVSGETMVKVDIAGPVAPSRILHQFDAANHFATHSFLFDNARDSGLVSSASIRVISRRRMLDDAWHIEVPVLIEVPSQSDTLPVIP
jgi:Mg-chelatase subunit ChlD